MHSGSDSGNLLLSKSATDLHDCGVGYSESSASNLCVSGLNELRGPDVKWKEENQESDESDSEIFRVKRRSSAKVDTRIVLDSPSISLDRQVFGSYSICCSF